MGVAGEVASPLTCLGEAGSAGNGVDRGEVEGCIGELGPKDDGRGLFEYLVLGGVVDVGVGEGEGEGGRDITREF